MKQKEREERNFKNHLVLLYTLVWPMSHLLTLRRFMTYSQPAGGDQDDNDR